MVKAMPSCWYILIAFPAFRFPFPFRTPSESYFGVWSLPDGKEHFSCNPHTEHAKVRKRNWNRNRNRDRDSNRPWTMQQWLLAIGSHYGHYGTWPPCHCQFHSLLVLHLAKSKSSPHPNPVLSWPGQTGPDRTKLGIRYTRGIWNASQVCAPCLRRATCHPK